MPRFNNMYKYISIAVVGLKVIIIEHICFCLCIQFTPYLMKYNYLIVEKSECKTFLSSNTNISEQIIVN